MMNMPSLAIYCARSFVAPLVLLLATTSMSTAAGINYSSSSNMGSPYTSGNVTFGLAMLQDGISDPAKPNGYAVEATSGKITFNLGGRFEDIKFNIWNNIVVDKMGGIKNAKLVLYDGNNVVAKETISFGLPTDAAPATGQYVGATGDKIVLEIASAFERVEIREIEFDGIPAETSYDKSSCNDAKLQKLPAVSHKVPEPRIEAIEFGVGKSYAIAGFRGYDQGGEDQIFVDRFDLVPKGHVVCKAVVKASGRTPANATNDSINIFIAHTVGAILNGGHWTSVGNYVKAPGNVGPLPAGKTWTRTWTIDQNTPHIAKAVAGGINSIDVVAQDDTTVGSVTVEYWVK